jgi:hypothetical protein
MEQLIVLPDATAELGEAQDARRVRRKTLKERARAAWAAARAGIGALLGVLPHVLHHVGIFAGTVLLAGLWGNAILYVAGLVLSIPMLRRLRHRFGSRIAPLIGVLAFTALFLFSAFVIGPALSGSQASPTTPPASVGIPAAVEDEHASHHG